MSEIILTRPKAKEAEDVIKSPKLIGTKKLPLRKAKKAAGKVAKNLRKLNVIFAKTTIELPKLFKEEAKIIFSFLIENKIHITYYKIFFEIYKKKIGEGEEHVLRVMEESELEKWKSSESKDPPVSKEKVYKELKKICKEQTIVELKFPFEDNLFQLAKMFRYTPLEEKKINRCNTEINYSRSKICEIGSSLTSDQVLVVKELLVQKKNDLNKTIIDFNKKEFKSPKDLFDLIKLERKILIDILNVMKKPEALKPSEEVELADAPKKEVKFEILREFLKSWGWLNGVGKPLKLLDQNANKPPEFVPFEKDDNGLYKLLKGEKLKKQDSKIDENLEKFCIYKTILLGKELPPELRAGLKSGNLHYHYKSDKDKMDELFKALTELNAICPKTDFSSIYLYILEKKCVKAGKQQYAEITISEPKLKEITEEIGKAKKVLKESFEQKKGFFQWEEDFSKEICDRLKPVSKCFEKFGLDSEKVFEIFKRGLLEAREWDKIQKKQKRSMQTL